MKKTKAKSKTKIVSKSRAQTTKRSSIVRAPIKHTKRLLGITPKFVHGMVVGAFVGLLLVGIARNAASANALNINASRDCTANAVIYCGALSTAELKTKYHQQGGVPEIYRYFKIYETDINTIDSTVVPGVAYKDGTVRLSSNGKIVATNSVSAGRQRIHGSVHYVKDGVDFYITSSQAAFLVNAIPVYISMKAGQFQFAIMPNCGNPVKATPTSAPKAAPKPVANVAPPVTPPATVAPPAAPLTVAPATTITTLPNTGPGAVIVIGLLAAIGGYIFHVTHRHVRKKRHHRTHHAAS